MQRITLIERVRRLIYGGQPSDDASITIGLVNNYLNDAVAYAAKTNYIDNGKLEGINFVNNSFYTTFKSLSVSQDEQFKWKITLPQIPIGIGTNDGVNTLIFKDSNSNQLSQPVVWMSESQVSIYQNMRAIPNKILAYPQGEFVYVLSTLLLSQYTAQITMVSGGDSTDLYSTLNVPSDYFPIMMQYLQQLLMTEFKQPVDSANDGLDAVTTT